MHLETSKAGMLIPTFEHKQSAHCENGVTVNLLRHAGMQRITEPLAFGMGSGLFYIHLPFVKLNHGPALSFRTMPGAIFKRTCRALHIKVYRKRFRDANSAETYLDDLLERQVPTGAQVSVFYLPYFPPEYRFHFNAHNLVIFGKEDGEYLVSDPIMEGTTSIDSEDLARARFARGIYAPKGHLYYLNQQLEDRPDLLRRGIIKGIKRNTRDMLHVPGGIAGVSGIKYTARKVRGWKEKLGDRKARLYLGQVVRMQEEIGTGGGGFRFLYAAFLAESADILDNDELRRVSESFTEAGDAWRDSAVHMAGIYKGRLTAQTDYDAAADRLLRISDLEKQAFRQLSKVKLT